MIRINLEGKRFGKLLVLRCDGSKDHNITWLCRCDCGNSKVSTTEMLNNGHVKSCSQSCYNRTHNPNYKHGLSYTYFQFAYTNMKTRCYEPTYHSYRHYGGRGIKVCDRWLAKGGLGMFAEDMGERPTSKHSLDRIDTNGDYSPENCRWADTKTQRRNTRGFKTYVYKGANVCVKDLSGVTGFKYNHLARFIRESNFISGTDITKIIDKEYRRA